MSTQPKINLAEIISVTPYLRERIDPMRGDFFYLHLSDLLIALKELAAGVSGRLLDYGCGGSPYRSLFSNCEYLRADYLVSPDLNYVIGDDGIVAEEANSFDVILSTQVLEHVRNAPVYLAEARRLLKPGGKLILSTHGTFEEHGCPYDFQRWTADGLKLLLSEAGFEVQNTLKLTTGVRAAFSMAEPYFGDLWHSRRTRIGWALWFFRNWFWTPLAKRHAWIDSKFPENRVVSADSKGHPFYTALLTESVRRD